MSGSMLGDAFGHHVWATLRVIDVCLKLSADQLQTTVPGTYGSIRDTIRHMVAADTSYLFAISGGRTPLIDADAMDVGQLRAAMEANGAEWPAILDDDLDPERVVTRRYDNGTEIHAPLGIRLAQVLHHGTDHRSQICTALTALGVTPPDIDVWDFGEQDGRVVEVLPAKQPSSD